MGETRRLRKRIGWLAAFALICVGLAACNSGGTATTSGNAGTSAGSSAAGTGEPKEAVKIIFPHYSTGSDTGAEFNRTGMQLFNEKYKGKYELIMEEIPGNEAYYEKVKLLAATDQLPPLFEPSDPNFTETLIKNNKTVDLKPYIDNNPEWKNALLEQSVEYNTADGKIVMNPTFGDVYIGILYNKELFAEAGIDGFPQTWDDMFAACETFQARGLACFAMNTGENAFTTGLLLSAILAVTPEGQQFMRTKYPTDFDQPFFAEAAATVARLFAYSTADAVGANYAMASNNFTSGNAAMIATGPWVLASFQDPKVAPEGFIDKVGIGLFPNQVAISLEGSYYGWGVGNNHEQEVIDGAVAWLEFLATPDMMRRATVAFGTIVPGLELTPEYEEQLAVPIVELNRQVSDVRTVISWFSLQWDNVVVNEMLAKELPLLALNQITPEQFGIRLAEAARKAEADRQ